MRFPDRTDAGVRLARAVRGGAALLALAAACLPAGADSDSGVHRLRLVVRETAGIRRFSYPVSVALKPAGSPPDAERFRLREKGKPVPAQFRRVEEPGAPAEVALDFNVNHAPLESREYVVEYGPGLPPAVARPGMRVEQDGRDFRVLHSPGLQFSVPRDLLGLLTQVHTRRTDFLRPGSAGLLLRYKDGIPYRAGGFGPDGVPTRARVLKEGPLACGLRFDSVEALRGGRSVLSRVDLEFPSSKSWVRIDWTVQDPERFVAGLGIDMNLNIQGKPTLVDFGAGGYVYATLRSGQRAALRAGSLTANSPAWQTLTGPAEALTPYAVAPPGAVAGRAEGWAHVMDQERCTAVAVAGVGEAGCEQEVLVDADGRLQVWRHFARDGNPPPAGAKTLTAWLHFVPMPVQLGAATSPQAMLAPLQVDVRPE